MSGEKKIWLITGVSSGFGQSLANALLARGDTVVGTMRKQEQCEAFDQLLPGRSFGVLLDVTDAAAIPAAVAKAIERAGHLDVLVNNAGYGMFGALEEMSDAETRLVFETNFFGTFNMMRAVLPHFRARKAGHIINLSSIAGVIGLPAGSIYCATKHAVEGMSDSMAREVQPFGIKVTIVEPGGFRTNFAGYSMKWSEATNPAYAENIGPMRSFMNSAYHGTQAGDPAKAAAAIIAVVDSDTPPLRLALGKDAVETVRKKIAFMQRDLDAWLDVSSNTGFTE